MAHRRVKVTVVKVAETKRPRWKYWAHFALISVVLLALLHEGGGWADWGFLILAVGVEIV